MSQAAKGKKSPAKSPAKPKPPAKVNTSQRLPTYLLIITHLQGKAKAGGGKGAKGITVSGSRAAGGAGAGGAGGGGGGGGGKKPPGGGGGGHKRGKVIRRIHVE